MRNRTSIFELSSTCLMILHLNNNKASISGLILPTEKKNKTFDLRFKEAAECPSSRIQILSKHFKEDEEASRQCSRRRREASYDTLKHARPKQILSNTDSHGGRGQFVACMHAHSHLHDGLFLCTSFESSYACPRMRMSSEDRQQQQRHTKFLLLPNDAAAAAA